MHDEPLRKPEDPRQTPWNKGKWIGSKPPLRTKDVWSIRTKLQVEKRTRDLAMFNSGHRQQATRLRCGQPAWHAVDRAIFRERKTRG